MKCKLKEMHPAPLLAIAKSDKSVQIDPYIDLTESKVGSIPWPRDIYLPIFSPA